MRMQPFRRQQGLAMVEFAISVPLLLFLLFAITEFGNVLYQYALLADAVRDADRYLAAQASVKNGTTGVIAIDSTLTAQTQNLVVYGNINGDNAGTVAPLLPGLAVGQVSVTSQADASGASEVTVSVAYPYRSLFGGAIPRFMSPGSLGTAFTLRAYTSMFAL
jgi:Flp pilus assembly protein TadG